MGPARLIRRRIEAWSLAFLLVFVGLGLKLFRLQIHQVRTHRKAAAELYERTWTLTAPRGALLDRNGLPLAVSVEAGSIFGDPSQVEDKPAAAALLAPILDLSSQRIQQCLSRDGQFAWLCRRAQDHVVAQVKALKIKGIGIKPEPKRVYPMGPFAADTLGFVTSGHAGGAGLEEAFQNALAGRDGQVWVEVDALGRLIPGRRRILRQPVPGRDLVLTLDARIQEIAEACLDQAVATWKAAGGTVLVMDPRTGEILALANRPTFDPNNYTDYPRQRWVNRAVSFAYEPGSTFKIVSVAAALEEGLYKPHDPVIFCRSAMPVGRRVIHCATHGTGGHGEVDLTRLIVKSCNLGAATVAFKLGRERFHNYILKFGFGRKARIGLSGEAAGSVPSPDACRDIRLANLGFGQGISVTPPQLLAAYCVIANHGVRPHPHLVKRIKAGSGHAAQTLSYPGTRVVSPETADTLREMLCGVVEEGTGKPARIEGYAVAGKTGTAQKAIPGQGFVGGKYVGSFVGLLPADNPRLAILVIIDEPQGGHYGAVVAAPTFREVASRSLACLGIPPTRVAQAQQPGG